MKFWDILKISCKNMMNNKLRTLLVWFMLFIMSTIVLVILSTGVGMIDFFNDNLNEGTRTYQDLTFEYKEDKKGEQIDIFKFDEIEQLENLIAKKLPQLKVIKIYCEGDNGHLRHNTAHDITITDMRYNMFFDQQDYMVSGRMWTEKDRNTSRVWINQSYANEFNKAVGDKIDIGLTIGRSTFKVYLDIFGIIKDDAIPGKNQKRENIFCDYSFMHNQGAKFTKIQFMEPISGEGLNYDSWKALKSFTNKYNKYDKVTKNGIAVYTSTSDFDLMYYIMLAIIFLMVIISVVVLLLSIGCVANSIQITVEQNAQFFGVMKAIGMRNSNLCFIIYTQAVIIILATIITASGAAVGLLSVLTPAILSFLTTLGAPPLQLSLTLPVYMPFIVLFVLVGLVVLWTAKSLKGLAKKDVITMINEVGQ